MNNFIKPKIIDHAEKIEELEHILLEQSGQLQEAHTMYAQIESEIDIVRKTTQTEPTDLLEMKEQLTFGGFLSICMMDLMVTSKNLLQARQVWEEVYYVRHIYLTIYETINSYHGYNKWIKETIEGRCSTLQPAFNMLSNRLKQFKRDFKYDTTIATIRNQTTAHIKGDFSDFFEKISSIDTEQGKRALFEFVHILNLMQKLVRDIGWLKFHEMLKKSDGMRGI